MRQILQYVGSRELKVEEIPPPALRGGGVLVASRCSLVSTGTERTAVDVAKRSLVGKALERPDLVRQVLQKMKTEGFATTLEKVRTRLDQPIALGYSCAGTVIAAAEDVDEFRVGDRVACAGAGYASHAEVVFVPRNLCVKIPEGVEFEDAAYVTLGSIAMQGVRVAEVTLGENVLLIGLGLLGQIALQILKSAGCKVLGVDIDPNKVDMARKLGADAAAVRGTDDVAAIAASLSRGRGMDAAVITAATGSNDPVELAADLLREKGRVAVVGAVKMDIPRKPFYDKELDLRLSRSYGPGRYDRTYEEHGVDYPIGYVRWTERRNMESFLELIAEGKVRTRELTTHKFDVADAERAYQMISSKKRQGPVASDCEAAEAAGRAHASGGSGNGEPFLGILLKYPGDERPAQRISLKPPADSPAGTLGIGMIGAGNFGRAMILPNLAKLDHVELRAVATLDGIESKRVAQRFGAEYATSSGEDVIGDERVNAVIIATRHDTHAALAIKALEAGKSVFVEKPLAMDPEQLDALIAAREKSSGEVVVDFNRRLSPLVVKLKEAVGSRTRPLVMSYRVNAGFIPRESWIQDPVSGGGRIIGEVCHFVDLMRHICGAPPLEVHAASAYADNEDRVNHDNTLITIRFADGSLGTLAYAADGDTRMPKERLEVFGDGSSFVVEDFKSAVFYRGGRTERINLKSQDKGHAAMLRAFADFCRGRGEIPVPFDEAVSATRVTFAILESLGLGAVVAVE